MLAFQLKTSLWVRKCSRLFQSGCWNIRFSSLTPGDANSCPSRQVLQGQRLGELYTFRIWLPARKMGSFSKLITKIATMMRRRRSWQQKWKGTCKKWILGSATLGRADFNIWQVEFTNLCYSYWRETSYSFRDLYLLRHAAVFLQHGNKFASAWRSSSSVIKIDMNCFKRLADNYSQHSIRKATSLEPPLSLKNNKKNQAPNPPTRQNNIRPPVSPPLFCFFDYLEPCNQTKLSFGTLGAVSLSSLSGCVAKQSILLLCWLGGSATTRGLQCFALAVKLRWQKFLSEADCI